MVDRLVFGKLISEVKVSRRKEHLKKPRVKLNLILKLIAWSAERKKKYQGKKIECWKDGKLDAIQRDRSLSGSNGLNSVRFSI